tara:strand:+ start:492 stop:716 length:225 start_codon:yes stop_codon:yes gene_type:complete
MELIEIFKDVFGEENIKDIDPNNISIDTLSVWDSLKHLRLLMTIEEEYNLNLTPNDFQELTSFSVINNYINTKK